ncbi:MAG: extracellular solute-binding protein [Spirochaetales bacterium]|nr:extracellular solute-binding protein [Spirochaetales bacterium]
MKITMKSIVAVVLLVVLSVPVFASGQSEGEAGKKAREISAMVMQTRNYEGLQDMMTRMKEEENIAVDLQVVPDDQYLNLIKIKANSGEATDLMDYNAPHILDIFEPEKYLVDLTDQEWTKRLINKEMVSKNGKIYAYPFLSTSGYQAMIYNMDVFEANGVEVPTTPEEFEAVCEKLKAGGVTPILLASDAWVPQIWMTSGYSRVLGSDAAAEDFAEKLLSNKAKLTDYPELEAPLDHYLSMFEKGYMNDDYLTLNIDGVYGKLGKGEGAMFFGSLGLANSIELAFPEGNFGMFNMPTSYDSKDLISGGPFSPSFVVSKDADDLETVLEVLNIWARPDYASMYFKGRPGFPALDGVNGGDLPPYALDIYNKYVKGGKVVKEMNINLNALSSLNPSTLWVYYQEAPSKGNMTANDILVRWQNDIEKFMTEQKAPGW